jgi:hypothetical protein
VRLALIGWCPAPWPRSPRTMTSQCFCRSRWLSAPRPPRHDDAPHCFHQAPP